MPKSSWNHHPAMADVERRLTLATEEVDQLRDIKARARSEYDDISERLYTDATAFPRQHSGNRPGGRNRQGLASRALAACAE